MLKHIKSILIISFILISGSLISQTSLSLKVSTISFNFIEKDYSKKYDLQLDDKGKLSFEPSIILGYERFFTELPLSVRFSQGIGIDVTGKLAGLTQCKLHLSVFRQWKSAINVSAGANLYYRKKPEGEISQESLGYSDFAGDFEYGSYLFTAAIEYNYSLNKNSDFSLSLNHYNKYKVYLVAGFRIWVSKDKKRKYKCLTCPDF